MKLNIRFATSEDTQHFYNLILGEKNKIHRQLGIFGIDNNEFDGTPFKTAFIAELEGEKVAFCKASGGDLTGFNYIGTFYVVPKHRKKGIGTELFSFIETYIFNNWNARGVDLYTIDNLPMEKLVKNAGFTLSGVYKKKYWINGKHYGQSRWMKLYK